MKFFTAELLISCSAFLAGANALDHDKKLEHSKSIIDWIRSKNGFFHSSLEMRHSDPSDLSSEFGMFSTANIKKGTLLFSIPDEVIIESDEESNNQLNCGLAETLLEEFEKGDKSAYGPYIKYLLDTQTEGQIPSTWSDAGKEMFMKTLGDEDFDLNKSIAGLSRYGTMGTINSLPPSDPISWIYQDWYGNCDGGDSELEEYAAIIVLQRSWDGALIPLFDMINHRKSQWLNTSQKRINGSLNVYASRDIYASEQIYKSFYEKQSVEETENYCTPFLFRDYGLVEDMPQTWMFLDMDLAFVIDELKSDDEDGNPQYDVIEWIGDELSTPEDIIVLEDKLEYIQGRIQILEDREAWADVPLHEWSRTKEYMKAMEVSVQTVLKWYRTNVQYPNSCIIDGECTVSIERYRDLDTEYKTDQEESYHKIVFLEDQEKIEKFKSQYQKISYYQSQETRNTCMDLENTIQICGSYRPHYHEYMVHQTARFLPVNSIKRVLFVGGGDSMLLHEALKYPSLELVVGLELDQKVTRGCFKHFGTQPHFDDDRVEWWFGDASKSLLMLPKDYFASFDLVLVDLSETVMSFAVTNELTVIEALTLLVKPDGIFVKNEVYFGELKNIFPYTAQIRWYDNPVVFLQAMVMGSRTVDFMNPMGGPTLTDHGVDTLVVRKLDDISDDFDLYHDYAFNAALPHLCDNLANKDHDKTQVSSPGILQIVEVEEVSGDLSSISNVQSSIIDALNASGMSVMSTNSYQSNDNDTESNKMLYVIMKEGYVIARAVAEKKYVGLDVFFWGSMHKQQSVTKALVAAVGGESASSSASSASSSSSSYRIITGGMFGVDGWEEDQRLRGPQFKELCKTLQETAPAASKYDGTVQEEDLYIAVEQGLSLIGRTGLKVAMLVSNEESAKVIVDDHSAKMHALEVVSEIVTFSCPSMANFNRYSEDANEGLTACERHLYEVLVDESRRGLLDVIMIDSTADKLTASILLEMLSQRRDLLVSQMLKKDSVVISSTLDRAEYSWRKHLLLHMKDEVFKDNPDAAFVDVSFVNSSSDSEFNLMMTSYGVENFPNRLNATVVAFNTDDSHSSLTARVQLLNGGGWVPESSITPSRVYLPEDYNQTGPLLQWMSQSPTGHQAVVQLEPDHAKESKDQEITETLLIEATYAAIRALNTPGMSTDSVKTFCDVGDGCLLVALNESGSLTILWDGRSHIDINLFTYVEDVNLVDVFVDSFLELIPAYTTMLRDEQPRGSGRVVSYRRDLDEVQVPHWATEI